MPEDQPNILLILTDQHRLSAVGACGPTPCQTPNIDRLAAEGVRFENAYTSCPVCTPARASIMTGMLPHNHGMFQNTEDVGSPVHALPDGPNLLSRQLEAAGYQLGYSGKWHLGSDNMRKMGAEIRPCLPKDVGFRGHNFPGHGNGGWDYPQFREYLRRRGLEHKVRPWGESTVPYRRDAHGGVLGQPIEGTVPYYLTENTIRLIDEFAADKRPFFLWHNFWGPHAPCFFTQEYLDIYRDVEIPEWPNFHWPAMETPGPHQFSITPQILSHGEEMTWDDWAMAVRYYYAFTTLIDDQIGRMVKHLRNRGLLESTVILFAADHGESLGDHGGIYNKGWTHFEEAHRIPMILRMPHSARAGTVASELVSLIDLYPTVLDLAGAPCPSPSQRPPRPADWPYGVQQNPDGESLLPLVGGREAEWRDTIVSEFHGLYDNSCIMRTLRHGQYKYGYTFLGRDELYDLAADPAEMNNVIDDPAYEDVAGLVREKMRQWMDETQDYALGGFLATRLSRAAHG